MDHPPARNRLRPRGTGYPEIQSPWLPPYTAVAKILLQLFVYVAVVLFSYAEDLISRRKNDNEKKSETAILQQYYCNDQEFSENSSVDLNPSPNPHAHSKDSVEEEEDDLQENVKTWELKVLEQGKKDSLVPHKDSTCCPTSNFQMIRLEDINTTASQIRKGIQLTPCMYSRLSKKYDMELYLKKEFLQPTGSVKDRGALSLLTSLQQDQQRKGVIVATDSNFSVAVAYHSAELKIPVFVIVPNSISISRVKLCRDYGAVVIIFGGSAKDSRIHAQQLAQKNGYRYLEEEDSLHYLSGLGTMGLEIFRQVPNLEVVVFPVGGPCGLLAGSAAALKQLNPQISVIGVQPENYPVLKHSLKMSHPVDNQTWEDRMFYGELSDPSSSKNTLQLVGQLVDKIVTVTQEEILIAMLRILEYERATVDAEGAIGLAAIAAGKLPELKGKRVAVVLSSGNLSLNLFQQCIQRALTLDSQICKFSLWMHDSSGDIARLLEILDREAIRVVDIQKEQGFVTSKLFMTKVTYVVETRDKQQVSLLQSALLEHYPSLEWIQ